MPETGMPNAVHDFNAPIEKTTIEIARKIVTLMDKNKESFLMPVGTELSEEEAKKIDDKAADFVNEIMKYISISDLPLDYITWPVARIGAFLTQLSAHINATVKESKDELEGLTLGVKSPQSNKYRAEVATMGDLLLALNDARTKRGTTYEDYLPEVVKPEISTEEKADTPIADKNSA